MTDPSPAIDVDALLAEEDFVRRLARGLLFDDHRVDDVVQQTWITALGSPPAASGRPALRAWLGTVVRRRAADEVRRGVRRERAERQGAPAERTLPSAEELLAREETRRIVVAELAALDEPFRTAVALRYLEGLEPQEIAARQGIPAATVRTRVARGLDKLRARLDVRHGGDRRGWCLALVPLAAATRTPSLVGMATATTAVTAIAMKLLIPTLAAALLAVLGLLFLPSLIGPIATPTDAVATDDAEAGTAAPTGDIAAAAPAPGDRRVALPPVAPTNDAADRAVGGWRGRLLDPDGAPLAGAVVRCVALDGPSLFLDGGGVVERVTRTDSDGRFRVAALPGAADCGLVADDGGDLRQTLRLPGSVVAGREVDLGDLRLAGRGVIVGTVVDADGAPAAGVEVLASDIPLAALAVLPAHHFDPTRGALLLLPRPRDPARAAPEIHARTVRAALSAIGRRMVADVSPDALTAHVLDMAPLRPLWHALPMSRATTGADGRFRIGGLPAGVQTLFVRGAGHAVATIGGATPGTMADPHDLGVIRMDAGETLFGFVADADGAPVADAEVRVAPIALGGISGVAPVGPPVTTASDGSFEVPGLERGRVLVVARRGPREPWTVAGPFASSGDAEITLPGRAVCQLEIRAEPGVDLSGLSIAARPGDLVGEFGAMGLIEGFRPLTHHAADEGLIELEPLTHGTWTLRLAAPGAAPVEVLVDAPRDTPLVVALPSARALEVLVLDHGGQPRAGTAVFVQDDTDLSRRRVLPSGFGLPQWQDALPRAAVHTDADGLAKILAAPASGRIVARDSEAGVAVAILDPQARPSRSELRLGGVGRVEGRVQIGPHTEHGLTGLRVVLVPDSRTVPNGAPPFSAAALLDADGRFAIDAVPTGRYRLDLRPIEASPPTLTALLRNVDGLNRAYADRGDVQSRVVDVAPGATVVVDFALGGADIRQGSIRGTVVGDGFDTAGMQVRCQPTDSGRANGMGVVLGLGRPDTVVDAGGGFLLTDLDPGRYLVSIRAHHGVRMMAIADAMVTAGRTTTVSMEIRTGILEGVVRDPEGAPVTDGEVVISRWIRVDAERQAQDYDFATVDAAGRFRVEDLPLGDWSFTFQNLALDGEHGPVAVTAGSTTTVEIRTRRIHRLQVTVSAAAIGDVEAVGLRAFPAAGGASASTWSMLSEVPSEREFELRLPAPGRYDLYVVTGPGTAHRADPPSVEITDPETTLNVRLGAPTELPDRSR